MKINKSTEDMLAFYGINNLSSDIGIENLIETLNNLSVGIIKHGWGELLI